MSHPQIFNEFSLVPRGMSHRVAHRLGLEHPDRPRRSMKVLVLLLVTWAPLLILSLAEGTALGGRVAVPLLRDPVIYSRFFFVVPMLVLAGGIVHKSLSVQARYFVESGVVPEREHVRFETAGARVIRLRDSVVMEGAILVSSLALSVGVRTLSGLGLIETNWHRSGASITLAGWWYILVSLPILFFLLLRWLWVFVLWAWFLFRVSRLDLELNPTHPDRSGGLGFLGWGLASFAIILLAVSAVMSGGFAYEIIHRGSSLNILKYHVIVFVSASIAVLHAPLLAFSGRLARCRFRGLLEFGVLCLRHDRAFDEKWIKVLHANRESILGSPDVSSLAHIADVFDHVERMRLIPFDHKAVGVLIAAVLIPMIPLLGTAVPLKDIISKLVGFLF